MSNNNNILSNINSLTKLTKEQIQKSKITFKANQEQENTHTYWTIGKLINEHILLNSHKKNYKQTLFPRLSKKNWHWKKIFISFFPVLS